LNYTSSIADTDPGSYAFLLLNPDPGSEIGFIPELGSRIPNPLNSLTIGANFFVKNKIIYNYIKFTYGMATKKVRQQTFFHSPLFVVGSGIRDSGFLKNQDPGSGINILDPQHCIQVPVHVYKLSKGALRCFSVSNSALLILLT